MRTTPFLWPPTDVSFSLTFPSTFPGIFSPQSVVYSLATSLFIGAIGYVIVAMTSTTALLIGNGLDFIAGLLLGLLWDCCIITRWLDTQDTTLAHTTSTHPSILVTVEEWWARFLFCSLPWNFQPSVRRLLIGHLFVYWGHRLRHCCHDQHHSAADRQRIRLHSWPSSGSIMRLLHHHKFLDNISSTIHRNTASNNAIFLHQNYISIP